MALYLFDGATPWDAGRLASVKVNSGIAVSVYIVGSPGGMRCANRTDVTLARSRGLGVIPNWERASDFFRTATLADCKAAGAEALAACRALGFPDDGTVGVAFSFDYQVPASAYPNAADQLQACGDGLAGHYQPLGYAQSGLCDYWAAHGLPGPHWLMASTWGEPYNPASPHVALVQSHDATGVWINSPVTGTDINTITQPDRLPAWWPTGSPYASGGTLMALTDQQQTDLYNRVMGFLAQRWYAPVKNPDGTTSLQIVPQGTAGAVPCHALDTMDGNYLATGIAGLLARVSDLQAKQAALAAEVDAIKQAQGTITVQPTDVPVTGTVHIGGTQ